MSELIFNRIILEKYNQTLSILIVFSLLVNLLLVGITFKLINKPPLIVYSGEGDISVLKAKSFKMDEALLQGFTKMIVSQYLNFSSTSLPNQIEGIAPYLSIKTKEAIVDAYQHHQLSIEKDGISQQFVINTIEMTKKNNPYWMEVAGVRTLYVNGNNKAVPIRYIFEIKKIKPSESNPYGLLVNDVIQKKDKAL
ncbi:MAG: hypothetical protein HQL15_07420 [Candidatus Omnitrophica bacterium]|nr:hypothetical protein [Candidatus Omnitrophota bacterium]